jgi:hypothetical protein
MQWCGASNHVQNNSSISGGCRNWCIARNCGHAKQVGVVRGDHQSHCIVMAGVTVKNHFYS